MPRMIALRVSLDLMHSKRETCGENMIIIALISNGSTGAITILHGADSTRYRI